MRALVRQLDMAPDLPDGATWAEVAAEARKVVSSPHHVFEPGRWLDDDGDGYFAAYARDTCGR